MWVEHPEWHQRGQEYSDTIMIPRRDVWKKLIRRLPKTIGGVNFGEELSPELGLTYINIKDKDCNPFGWIGHFVASHEYYAEPGQNIATAPAYMMGVASGLPGLDMIYDEEEMCPPEIDPCNIVGYDDGDGKVYGWPIPFVRSPYNYDTKAASDESGLKCEDPSRTIQSFAQESDINWIVENFTRNGVLPEQRQPQFGDFTNLPTDYHIAMNQIRNADAAFMTLPAKVRSEFDNDPGKLLAFVSDPKNFDRAVELGIFDDKTLPEKSPIGKYGAYFDRLMDSIGRLNPFANSASSVKNSFGK